MFVLRNKLTGKFFCGLNDTTLEVTTGENRSNAEHFSEWSDAARQITMLTNNWEILGTEEVADNPGIN